MNLELVVNKWFEKWEKGDFTLDDSERSYVENNLIKDITVSYRRV